jgi:hypothetical protein
VVLQEKYVRQTQKIKDMSKTDVMKLFLSLFCVAFLSCIANPNKRRTTIVTNSADVSCESFTGYNTDTIVGILLSPKIDKKDGLYSDVDYRIVSQESGNKFVLQAGGKEYALSDILDYGELDLLVYELKKNQVIFIGLIDTYGSVYYIYYLHEDTLTRLGELSFEQASNTEETGGQEAKFIVKQAQESINIALYLDEIFSKQISFTVR